MLYKRGLKWLIWILSRLLNKHIKINELRYLSSGDNSDTYLCDKQYVVKIPKGDSVRIAQK